MLKSWIVLEKSKKNYRIGEILNIQRNPEYWEGVGNLILPSSMFMFNMGLVIRQEGVMIKNNPAAVWSQRGGGW